MRINLDNLLVVDSGKKRKDSMNIFLRAEQLYYQAGYKLPWIDFIQWSIDNERYGYRRYLDKAQLELTTKIRGI